MSQVSSSVSLGVVPIGVGIDTARYGHHVSFLDQQKRSAAKSFHFVLLGLEWLRIGSHPFRLPIGVTAIRVTP